MKFRLLVKYSILISLAVCLSLLCGPKAIQALETAISGAIGAMVGGVLSALAFAFSIMSRLTKESLAADATNDNGIGIKYSAITSSLYSDVHALIWCLAGAIFLPLIREVNFPLISLPVEIAQRITRSELVTSLEILLVVVSISVLFEVCNCMFQTLIADSHPTPIRSTSKVPAPNTSSGPEHVN